MPTLVLRAVREFGLWRGGEPVLVAVSGGPDSTALLAAVLRLPGPWRPTATAVHLDHGLRRSSAAEADAVRRLAADLGVAAVVGARDASAPPGCSPEAAARAARYRFLADVAREAGAAAVAVGHHRDDQAETVLLRLTRGAGARGLAGFRPSRPLAGSPAGCRLVRPLWFADRSDVARFLQSEGLPWIEDESNRDPRRPRNRIRHELLPELRREFGPEARAAILRCADNLAAEDEALAIWTAREAAERLRGPRLALAGWERLPRAIRHRLVQLWWERSTGLPPLSRALTERLPGSRGLDLPGGWRGRADGRAMELRPAAPRPAFLLRCWVGARRRVPRRAARGGFPLPVPGSVAVPGVGRLRAEVAPRPCCLDGRLWAFGVLDGLALPLRVRAPLPGERVAVSGMAQRRAVRELLRSAGIPPSERRLPRVVADAAGRVLWVVGARAPLGQAGAGVPGPGLLLTLEAALERRGSSLS